MVKYFRIFFLLILFNLFLQQAFAYIDPGTASAIFSSIIPYLLMILSVTLGFLIWPFRRFYQWFRDKWGEGRKWLALLLSIAIVLAILSIVAVVFILILV